MKLFLSLVTVFVLSGCVDAVGRDMEMERAAQNFSNAADECLYDVRDRHIPYARSYNCTKQLDRTSSVYLSFPNTKLIYTGEAAPRHAYIAEVAKSVAWSALALSNGMYRNQEPVLSLW